MFTVACTSTAGGTPCLRRARFRLRPGISPIRCACWLQRIGRSPLRTGTDRTSWLFRGPPGVGKRETARFWLQGRAEQFPDGHFYADLGASVEEDGLESTKLREFLLAVGHDPEVVPDSAEGRAAWFRSWSSGKRVAVSVDKALTPRQVRMLAPGPGPSVMVVTEAGPLAALGVSSAVTFIDLEPLEESAARELLGRLIGDDRVAAEPDAVAAVLRICAGLPIALSVVGALLGAFPSRRMSRLVAELDDEKRRLQAMSRDAELSVTTVFNTAYQRLSALGRRCYRVLGLHPGTADFGIDVPAAALELPEYDVRDAVDELLVAGLVREVSDDRYLLHSLVRLHATRLAESTDPVGDRDTTLTRMLDPASGRCQARLRDLLGGRGAGPCLRPPRVGGDRVGVHGTGENGAGNARGVDYLAASESRACSGDRLSPSHCACPAASGEG
jgi:hypothetical protein